MVVRPPILLLFVSHPPVSPPTFVAVRPTSFVVAPATCFEIVESLSLSVCPCRRGFHVYVCVCDFLFAWLPLSVVSFRMRVLGVCVQGWCVHVLCVGANA